jgi:hypothetical protein
VARPVANLHAGTLYYYCIVGSNSAGTDYGTVRSFTTQAAPVALPTLSITANNQIGTITVNRGTPVNIRATFAPAPTDTLSNTAINGPAPYTYGGVPSSFPWAAAPATGPLDVRQYTFTPQATGDFTFIPAAITSKHPSPWYDANKFVTIHVTCTGSCVPCPPGQAVVGGSCQPIVCPAGSHLLGSVCVLNQAFVSPRPGIGWRRLRRGQHRHLYQFARCAVGRACPLFAAAAPRRGFRLRGAERLCDKWCAMQTSGPHLKFYCDAGALAPRRVDNSQVDSFRDDNLQHKDQRECHDNGSLCIKCFRRHPPTHDPCASDHYLPAHL